MSDAPRESLRDLAPGYALGALTPEETRAFETALPTSPELQQDLAEFRELSALLALRDSQAPGPDLKRRLRERIRGADATGLPPKPLAAPTRRSFAPVALGLGLAASLLLAAGLFLRANTLAETLAEREHELAERDATLAALLEPSVQLTTLTATGEAPPVVKVFWNRGRHSLLLQTFRLKPAPEGQAYQLWLMPKNGAPIPSQVFNTEPGGRQLVAGVAVPADQEITGFAITVEPAAGSPQPTSTPILAGTVGAG